MYINLSTFQYNDICSTSEILLSGVLYSFISASHMATKIILYADNCFKN